MNLTMSRTKTNQSNKRLYGAALVAALLCAGSYHAAARSLSPAEALGRAMQELPGQATTLSADARLVPQCVYTASTGSTPLYYIFDTPATDGFMVTPADDRLRPVLAVVDGNGGYDDSTANPTLQWWLGQYETEIAYILSQPATVADNSTGAVPRTLASLYAQWADIAPICTTTWNQGSPYNLNCPIDPSTGKQCVTGCVATAFAQVLKAHRSPACGSGTKSYKPDHIGKTLTFNYAQHPFEWDKMLDEYSGNVAESKKQAVANLMYACGVGVEMQYSSSESGAWSWLVADAAINYLGYSEDSRYYPRHEYSSYDWEQMVYTELEAGRPVYYSGSGPGGAHAFVCDGYAYAGLYHFNWGWGGVSDGYYALTALSPGVTGIGGGSGGGFSQSQEIVTLIPAGQIGVCYERSNAPLQAQSISYTLSGTTLRYTLASCYASYDLSFRFNLKGVDTDGNEQIYTDPSDNKLSAGWGWGSRTISLSTASFKEWPAGTYTVTPACTDISTGEVGDVHVKNAAEKTIIVTVSAKGSVTVAYPDRPLHLINVVPSSPLYAEGPATISVGIANDSQTDWYGPITLVLTNAKDSKDAHSHDTNGPVFIPAGDYQPLTISVDQLSSDGSPLTGTSYYATINNSAGRRIALERHAVAVNPGTGAATSELEIRSYYPTYGNAMPSAVRSGTTVTIDSRDIYYFMHGSVTKKFDVYLNIWKADDCDPAVKPEASVKVLTVNAEAGSPYIWPLANHTLPKLTCGKYVMRYTNADATEIYSTTFPLTVYSYNSNKLGFYLDSEAKTAIIYAYPGMPEFDELTVPEEMRLSGTYYPVSGIDEATFAMSRKLTSVHLPASLTQIGANAFRYTLNLTDMRLDATTPVITCAPAVMCGVSPDIHIHVPAEVVEQTRKDLPLYAGSVYSIWKEAAANCSELSVAAEAEKSFTVTFSGADADSDLSLNVSTADAGIATAKVTAVDAATSTVTVTVTGVAVGTTTLNITPRLPGVAIAPVALTVTPKGAVETVEADAVRKGIYDLQGRRLKSVTAPGIYIIDGVKTMVK